MPCEQLVSFLPSSTRLCGTLAATHSLAGISVGAVQSKKSAQTMTCSYPQAGRVTNLHHSRTGVTLLMAHKYADLATVDTIRPCILPCLYLLVRGVSDNTYTTCLHILNQLHAAASPATPITSAAPLLLLPILVHSPLLSTNCSNHTSSNGSCTQKQ